MMLPSSWEKTRLIGCCDIIQGQSPPGETYNEVGEGLPFFQGKAEFGATYPTARKWCTAPTKIAGVDDVLISVRAPVGPTNLCPAEACIGRGLAAIRPLGGIPPRYILYALRATESALAAQGTGSTFAAISGDQLKQHTVNVAPLPEQDRIVAEIEKQFTRLDDAVAALRRVQANLKRYRASVLKAACEGRLVSTEAELARKEGRIYEPASDLLKRILADRRAKWEADQLAKMQAAGKPPKNDDWKKKYKEPQPPDTSSLPPLPEGWAWAGLEQLGEVNRGKSKHRPRNDPRLLGGPYPFVQTGDVKHSRGRIRRHSQTYSEFGLAQSRLWPEGTLCITIAANIADSGVLTYPGCFPDSVVGFVPAVHKAELTSWADLFLRGSKQEIARFAPATAQKNINLEILSKLAVPMPPLAEMQRIIADVDRRASFLDTLETEVGRDYRCTTLRSAILKRAFEGKLVPQDPADEPASVLLERIRAERSTGTKKAKPRSRSRAVAEAG